MFSWNVIIVSKYTIGLILIEMLFVMQLQTNIWLDL